MGICNQALATRRFRHLFITHNTEYMQKNYKALVLLGILVLQTTITFAQISQDLVAASWKDGNYKWWTKDGSKKLKRRKVKKVLTFTKNSAGRVTKIVMKGSNGKHATHVFTKDSKHTKFVRYFTNNSYEREFCLFFTQDRVYIFAVNDRYFMSPKSPGQLLEVIGKRADFKKDEKVLEAGLVSNWKKHKVEYDVYLAGLRKAKRRRQNRRLRTERSLNDKTEKKRKLLKAGAYAWVRSFKEGMAKVSIDKVSEGFINKKGVLVIPTLYNEVRNFSEGLAAVQRASGKWGFIDKTGKMVIPAKYEDVGDFSEGATWAKSKSIYGSKTWKYVMINKSGKAISSPKYLEDIGYFVNGLARMKNGDKWGVITNQGNIKFSAKYKDIGIYSEGLLWVSVGRKHGYINYSGRPVIHTTDKYTKAYSFNDGWALVRGYNNDYGFIDKRGRKMSDQSYEGGGSFSEGLACVKLNGKWGFIDKTGNMAIPAKYQNVYSFSEGLARVKIKGKWGFINKTGRLAIPAKYADVVSFSEGLAKVEMPNQWIFINQRGATVLKLKRRK